jgi:glycosyltransferase involved in cell wall biosynthesis
MTNYLMNLLQYTMGQMNIEQNNNPLVSVIIPTNNRFHSLINAINSVINQTYRPIQLIIVNDGADDQNYYDYNFQELVKDEKDIELIMFQHKFSSKEKFGYNCSSYPRNTGINLSRGKYVAFLDDNYIWELNKLETQIEIMEKTNTHFSCTDVNMDSDYYSKIENSNHQYIINQNQYNINIISSELINLNNIIITSSVILSKELINNVGKITHIPDDGKVINNVKDYSDWNYWKKCLTKTNSCLYIK